MMDLLCNWVGNVEMVDGLEWNGSGMDGWMDWGMSDYGVGTRRGGKTEEGKGEGKQEGGKSEELREFDVCYCRGCGTNGKF